MTCAPSQAQRGVWTDERHRHQILAFTEPDPLYRAQDVGEVDCKKRFGPARLLLMSERNFLNREAKG